LTILLAYGILIAAEEIPVIILDDVVRDRIVRECNSDPACIKHNEDEFFRQLIREREYEKRNI
jgi:hypothetical protein